MLNPSIGKIALFCKAWMVGRHVCLCKCVQCALAEIIKNAKRGLFSFLSIFTFWITLSLSLYVIVSKCTVFFFCMRHNFPNNHNEYTPNPIKFTRISVAFRYAYAPGPAAIKKPAQIIFRPSGYRLYPLLHGLRFVLLPVSCYFYRKRCFDA